MQELGCQACSCKPMSHISQIDNAQCTAGAACRQLLRIAETFMAAAQALHKPQQSGFMLLAAGRRLVRLAAASARRAREAQAQGGAAVIDLITPAREGQGLSDAEEPGPSRLALVSPPTTGPAG